MALRISAFFGSIGFVIAATLAQAQDQAEPQPAPVAQTPALTPQPSNPAAEAAPNEAQPTPPAAGDPLAQTPVAPGESVAPEGAAPDPDEAVDGTELYRMSTDLILPSNLSPWGMFVAADIVVKLVMIGLAIASLISWTVFVAKALELISARKLAQEAALTIGQAKSLGEASHSLAGSASPATLLILAAREEIAASEGALTSGEGIKERIASRLSRIEVAASRRMSRGTSILATIGATAPFIGLFGTVWGIMNSFIGISAAQTTNLAIVAPGIAEALLATALGLVAAVPAVIFYNIFARSITGYRHILADASAAIERLVSRDLDFRESVVIARRHQPAAQ